MKKLEALIKSRDHWVEMRDDKNSSERPNKNGCALCDLYYYINCKGCPLLQKKQS